VPASKYWYLGDVIGAVPKNFFKFWTPFTFFAGVALTAVVLLTDWLQQLLNKLFFGGWWYYGWFGSVLLIIIFVLIRFGHKGKRHE
jgi:hypothetical protein